MHFDLVDLRLFVNIAEANSLTRGAEKSALSLPAASMRIKNLEAGLGSRLLDRSSQGVTLTAPGQAFAHHARLVLGQLEQLRGELQEYAQGVKGHLRVAASTTAISEFLPAVLRTYLASHPDVNVDLRESFSTEVVRSVTEGRSDIGIVAGDVRTEGLQAIPYRIERLVLVVPPAHPLAARAAVRFEETLEFDHVALHETSAMFGVLQRAASELRRKLKVRIHLGGFEAQCRMVEVGVGIGMLPSSAAERHRQTMDLRLVDLQDDWATRRLRIVARALDELPVFARALVDLLASDAAEDAYRAAQVERRAEGH